MTSSNQYGSILETEPRHLLFNSADNEPSVKWLSVRNRSANRVAIQLTCFDTRLALRPNKAIIEPESVSRFSCALKPMGCEAVKAETQRLLHTNLQTEIEVSLISRDVAPDIGNPSDIQGERSGTPSTPRWTTTLSVPYTIQGWKEKQSNNHHATCLYFAPPERFTFEPPYDGFSTAYFYVYNPTSNPILWYLHSSTQVWFKMEGDGSLGSLYGRLGPGESAFRYIDFKGFPRHFTEFGGPFDRQKTFHFKAGVDTDPGQQENLQNYNNHHVVHHNASLLVDPRAIDFQAVFADPVNLQGQPLGRKTEIEFVFKGKVERQTVWLWFYLTFLSLLGPYDQTQISIYRISKTPVRYTALRLKSDNSTFFQVDQTTVLIAPSIELDLQATLINLAEIFQSRFKGEGIKLNRNHVIRICMALLGSEPSSQNQLNSLMENAEWQRQVLTIFAPCHLDEAALCLVESLGKKSAKKEVEHTANYQSLINSKSKSPSFQRKSLTSSSKPKSPSACLKNVSEGGSSFWNDQTREEPTSPSISTLERLYASPEPTRQQPVYRRTFADVNDPIRFSAPDAPPIQTDFGLQNTFPSLGNGHLQSGSKSFNELFNMFLPGPDTLNSQKDNTEILSTPKSLRRPSVSGESPIGTGTAPSSFSSIPPPSPTRRQSITGFPHKNVTPIVESPLVESHQARELGTFTTATETSTSSEEGTFSAVTSDWFNQENPPSVTFSEKKDISLTSSVNASPLKSALRKSTPSGSKPSEPSKQVTLPKEVVATQSESTARNHGSGSGKAKANAANGTSADDDPSSPLELFFSLLVIIGIVLFLLNFLTNLTTADQSEL